MKGKRILENLIFKILIFDCLLSGYICIMVLVLVQLTYSLPQNGYNARICREGSTKHKVDDCNAYYQCVRGEYLIRRCPPNLHFNAELQVCDYPSEANCVELPVEPTTPKPTSTEPTTSTAVPTKTTTSTTPVPTTPNTTTTPESTTSKPSSTTTSRPELLENDCPASNPNYNVFLPHSNCNRMYLCDWGVPYEHRCPKGLHWNQSKTVCQSPSDANCREGEARRQPGAVLLPDSN